MLAPVAGLLEAPKGKIPMATRSIIAHLTKERFRQRTYQQCINAAPVMVEPHMPARLYTPDMILPIRYVRRMPVAYDDKIAVRIYLGREGRRAVKPWFMLQRGGDTDLVRREAIRTLRLRFLSYERLATEMIFGKEFLTWAWSAPDTDIDWWTIVATVMGLTPPKRKPVVRA
jgi:hypothetical protein